jgi:hypothetical protein
MKLKSARNFFCFFAAELWVASHHRRKGLTAKTAIYRKLLKTLMGCSFPPPDEEKKCPMHFQMSFNFALGFLLQRI